MKKEKFKIWTARDIHIIAQGLMERAINIRNCKDYVQFMDKKFISFEDLKKEIDLMIYELRPIGLLQSVDIVRMKLQDRLRKLKEDLVIKNDRKKN